MTVLLFCTFCSAPPHDQQPPCHPSLVRLFTHLLGIRKKKLRFSRLRLLLRINSVCMSSLVAGFLFFSYSFFFYSSLPPPPFFWKRKREKEQERRWQLFFFYNDVLLSARKEKHLWNKVCLTVYMTVQVGACQAPDRLLMLQDRHK